MSVAPGGPQNACWTQARVVLYNQISLNQKLHGGKLHVLKGKPHVQAEPRCSHGLLRPTARSEM